MPTLTALPSLPALQLMPGKHTIELSKIKELRRGKKTEVWRRRAGDTEGIDEAVCLSLVYGNDFSTLDLHFGDRKAYLEWYGPQALPKLAWPVAGVLQLLRSADIVSRGGQRRARITTGRGIGQSLSISLALSSRPSSPPAVAYSPSAPPPFGCCRRVTGLDELLFDLHETSTVSRTKRLTQDELIAIFNAHAVRSRRHHRRRRHVMLLPRKKVRRLLFHNDPSLATPANAKYVKEYLQDPATWFGLDMEHWMGLSRMLSWRPDITTVMEGYSSYDEARTAWPH